MDRRRRALEAERMELLKDLDAIERMIVRFSSKVSYRGAMMRNTMAKEGEPRWLTMRSLQR